MNRTFLQLLRAWHAWRQAWWWAVEKHAEAMREYHGRCTEDLHRTLHPKPDLSIREALEQMKRREK